LIINSSFNLFLIETFWVLLFTAFQYYCISFNFSQMTYFYIICLYLKLKLRNANNCITKSFEKTYKMTNNRMKNILIPLNSIISEINTYNNDLWSKYLMIVLMFIILVLDLVLFEAIFGKMNFFFKLIIFYASSVLFLLLIILINTASSVAFESNKSYKLLNKSFITNKKQISIRMRIKVWIQTINLFLILIKFYLIFSSQLLSLIERISKKNIGFYCWKIFIFNYFRVYEVSLNSLNNS
jgi:hypothetical protein